MAQRRMLSLKIIDTDEFLDMPMSSQFLYFNLAMRADDDGFVGNPKRIMRMVGCSDDDIKVLIAKRFVIPFDSGVCVIRHWRVHNYIQSDRYTPTEYKEELNILALNEGKYEKPQGELLLGDKNVSKMYPQVRLGKERIEVRERELHSLFEKKITIEDNNPNKILLLEEKLKFLDYWTEKSDGGRKERWQMEKVFDVRRRWNTWLGRVKKDVKEMKKETISNSRVGGMASVGDLLNKYKNEPKEN